MTILAASNCVYAVPRAAVARGYALDGIRSAPPLLVMGASFSDTDLNLTINTLNKKRFLYNFGKGFSDGQLMGIALLGMSGNIGLARTVDSMRTSSGKGAVSFSTPLGGYRVFVTGFGMAPPDNEYNVQPFSILFKIAS